MVSSGSPPASANPAPEKDLTIRPIQPGDQVAGLSLGKPEFVPLKSFLRDDARHYHENNIAKTYVLVPVSGDPIVRGYISLMCSELTLDEENRPEDGEYRYPQFPSVKIARLAVDQRFSSLGFGSGLVQLALGIARDEIMPAVGCRFLIVDAKQSAIEWYRARGFVLHESREHGESPLLFVDLQNFPDADTSPQAEEAVEDTDIADVLGLSDDLPQDMA